MNGEPLTGNITPSKGKHMTTPNDSGRINIRQQYEVQYWTKKLDLTATQLADIIETVGDSIDAVRTHVGR